MTVLCLFTEKHAVYRLRRLMMRLGFGMSVCACCVSRKELVELRESASVLHSRNPPHLCCCNIKKRETQKG